MEKSNMPIEEYEGNRPESSQVYGMVCQCKPWNSTIVLVVYWLSDPISSHSPMIR